MNPLRRLGVRLFLSYLLIVLVTAGVVFATARSLAPTIFRVTLEQEQGEEQEPEPTTTVPPTTSRPPVETTTTAPTTTTRPTSTTRPGATSTTGPGTTTTGGGSTTTVTTDPTTTTSSDTTPTTTQPTSTTAGGGSTSTVTIGPTTTTRPGTTTTTGPRSPTTTTSATGRGLVPGTYAAGDGTVVIELDEEVERAFTSSITTALAIAIGVAVVVAGGLAFVVSRRVMLPVARVRAATVRLAEGHYEERVPEPTEVELAGLASDVNRLAERLEAAETRRNRLISDVAHELRTPLTTIQGSMEGLVDGVIEPSPAVYLSVAEEAARLQRIVADLGLLSRLDESALELHLARVDVGAILRRVVDRLGPQFDDRSVGIDVVVGGGLETDADADRLAQVFTNLLGNALAHSPSGARVTIDGERTGDRIRVAVQDEGRGIPPELTERIFDRFYRIPGSGRSGTGLGLTIARNLARAHGGDVTAQSDGPGRGARFVVELPVRGSSPPGSRLPLGTRLADSLLHGEPGARSGREGDSRRAREG